MRIEVAIRQRGRSPPFHSFQKAQAASRLFAPIFSLDSFLQSSLSKDGEFCKGLSIFSAHLQSDVAILALLRKNDRKIFCFAEKWPRCRGPPASEIKAPQISEEQEVCPMRQFYIRKSQHMANGNIPVDAARLIGRIYMNCTISVLPLLHNAEFTSAEKNLILIGTARSYLAVILPNMDPGTGGECG